LVILDPKILPIFTSFKSYEVQTLVITYEKKKNKESIFYLQNFLLIESWFVNKAIKLITNLMPNNDKKNNYWGENITSIDALVMKKYL
jgi:hypothetical protein